MKAQKAANRAAALVLALILLLSCAIAVTGEGGNGDGTGGGKDKPLTLESSSIANGAENVSQNPQIVLTFSKNVVHFTVRDNNKQCFSMTDEDGNAVPIDVVMGDDQVDPSIKRIITIVPQNALTPGTTYLLVIGGGITSKSGVSIGRDSYISFTVAGEKPAPTEAPTAKPSTTQPATTRPATTQPATTAPATTVPASTRPAATRPGTTAPAATQPAATTRPATTAPATTRPGTVAQVTTTAAAPTETTTLPDVPDTTPAATEDATGSTDESTTESTTESTAEAVVPVAEMQAPSSSGDPTRPATAADSETETSGKLSPLSAWIQMIQRSNKQFIVFAILICVIVMLAIIAAVLIIKKKKS
ncbi:MAG: Ig-like domain-containing protein [Clostridia bacterium]|nr:Ig-like domain-containing protein [Clostridia bacterium]